MLLFLLLLRRGCRRFVLRPARSSILPSSSSLGLSPCSFLCVLPPDCCAVLCAQSSHVSLCCCVTAVFSLPAVCSRVVAPRAAMLRARVSRPALTRLPILPRPAFGMLPLNLSRMCLSDSILVVECAHVAGTSAKDTVVDTVVSTGPSKSRTSCFAAEADRDLHLHLVYGSCRRGSRLSCQRGAAH